MTVDAVVVYYATPAQIGATVAALRGQREPLDQIVVIDNSAIEQGTPVTERSDPGVRWEISESNCGYGAACNRGSTLTHGDCILFSNADLQLDDTAVGRLRERLLIDPTAAVVGPRIFGGDGQVELSARRFPTIGTGLVGRMSVATRVLRRLGWIPPALRAANTEEAAVVDWVSGACMLVRRSAFEAVGGFDESYWMYWEDADLCRRLHDRGWRAWVEPTAVGRHATGSSGRNARTIHAFHTSASRYYALHAAPWPAAACLARNLLKLRAQILVRRLGWLEPARGPARDDRA